MAAIIGLLQVEIHIPTANSLKDKRSIIKRLIHRMRQDFNVAAAELDDQDIWRRSVLGAVTVFNSRQVAEQTLRRVLHMVENTDGCEVLDSQIEFL